MKKRSYLLIMVLAMAMLFNGCTPKPNPEDTIYKLEDAINEYDMQTALECFEPSVQKIYSGALEVGSSLLGMDIETVLDTVGGIADMFGVELLEEDMPTIDIEIVSQEEISDEEVKMNLDFTITYAGESETENIDVTLVLIKGEWYISGETDLLDYLQ